MAIIINAFSFVAFNLEQSHFFNLVEPFHQKNYKN